MNQSKKKLNVWLFIIPSILGASLFLIPFKVDGSFTIGVGAIKDVVLENASDFVIYLLVAASVFTAITTIVFKIKNYKSKNKFINQQFGWSNLWSPVKIIGAIIAVATIITNPLSGSANDGFIGEVMSYSGVISLYDLLPSIAVMFFISGFLLPLMMSFGLMEFIGGLISPAMRPLFKVPGRSSVDAVTSLMGDGTLGVHITEKQYEQGHYTKKEAAAVAVSFSLVSLPFTIIIMEEVGLSSKFFLFYGTVVIISVILAIIIPRIPPISKIEDKYIDGKEKDTQKQKGNLVKNSYNNALVQANSHTNYKKFLVEGFQTGIGALLTLVPVVLAIGSVAMIIQENTDIFVWLSWPIEQALELFNVADAAAIAGSSIIGFADMFLPAIVYGSDMSLAEGTRFIIGALSVIQLLFLSETGAAILKSKLSINLPKLFLIFLIRTIIALPLLILIAKIAF